MTAVAATRWIVVANNGGKKGLKVAAGQQKQWLWIGRERRKLGVAAAAYGENGEEMG
jgi:hypothetical protein